MRRRLIVPAVWLLGLAGLWWGLPPAPRAAFAGATKVSADGVVVTVAPLPDATPTDPFVFSSPPLPSDLEGIGPVEGRDVFTGRLLWSVHGPEVGAAAGLTDDGRRVIVRVGRPGGREAEAVEVREAATGDLVGRFPGGTEFSPPDARLALTGSHDPAPDRAMHLVETATGRWVRRLPTVPGSPGFSPDGRRLLVSHHARPGGSVYDTVTGRLVARFADPAAPSWFGGDGRRLLGRDGTVWDVDAHAAERRLQAVAEHAGWVSPDGRWASETLDGLDEAGRSRIAWTVVGGGEQRVTPPAGFRVSSQSDEERGRLLTAYLARERPAGAFGRWLADQHPALWEWRLDRTDRRTLLLDPATAAVVADLPENTHFARLSPDGRTLYTWTFREKSPLLLQAWHVPPRPSPALFTALAAGWTFAVAVVTRRLRRPALIKPSTALA